MEDIVKVVQWSRLQWYGRAMRKDDGDLVKNCYFGVEGARQRDGPRETWKEVVHKDMDDMHIR